MTEQTTEEQIAKLAKDRAKTILENGDFWGSPGAANTSATAVTALVALGNSPVTIAKANAVAAVEEAKPARKNAKAPANESESPDA